ITCCSRSSSVCDPLKLKGKLCVAQPKTSFLSSHHSGPTGISALTLPAFLPSASLSTRVMSPSASTFRLTRRPVRLYHFCSAGILVSVSGVKGTFGSGPFHSEICDGVTDRMVDLSKGTGDGSVLAGQRLPPFWLCRSPGETKGAAAAFTDVAKTHPMTNAARG